MKKILLVLVAVIVGAVVIGCAKKSNVEKNDSSKIEKKDNEKLTLVLAASLKTTFYKELIPMFNKLNPNVKIETNYGGSGTLEKQIEEGIDADVFMSAAPKWMNILVDKGFVEKNDVVNAVENTVVLIVPKSNEDIKQFKDIDKAKKIAIGDPKSVPAGKYAEEILTNLGVFEKIQPKLSLAKDVTEVLTWVSQEACDAGVVYSTDAMKQKDKVKVVENAPAGTLKNKVVYPLASLKKSKNKELSDKFVKFLQSDDAKKVFEKYGFIVGK